MALIEIATWLALALSASAAAVEKRTTCSSYTLINTRGTAEAQGPSASFITMNTNIQKKLSGGKVYNTEYPAAFDQQSQPGTQDIINKIKTTLATSPHECFILEGYSQGATATVDALSQLTGANFNAVKGVFLTGNPDHKSGLTCNVDTNGGTTTRDVDGLFASGSAGIPSNWVRKTLDVCNYGDGICDTTNGFGINAAHLAYPDDAGTQNLGTKFVVAKLSGTS